MSVSFAFLLCGLNPSSDACISFFNFFIARSMTAFKGDCRVLKLFAKHIKVKGLQGNFGRTTKQLTSVIPFSF